jgi:hypothetical protein
MRHFLFEDKDYRYRVAFKRHRIPDPAVELARLLRSGFTSRRLSGRPERRADVRQKCVVKMQYSNSKEAHMVQLEKYLVREGAGLDGKPPRLFGTNIEAYKANMAEKNFRIFLSPQSGKADLKLLAERFVARLEKQTGYKLYWQGACHYNTAHPHAHLLINGVDQSGRKIRFPPDIVKTFMRETARDICTDQLGIRTKQDLELEKEQELTAPRLTRFDNRLSNLCSGSRLIPNKAYYDYDRVLSRLEVLKKLNLCAYKNGVYIFKDNWQEDLSANGRYNVFLKAREQLRYTDASLMQTYSGKQGQVTGIITKVYRTDDDASDNHVAVLEGVDGAAYFIPLLKAPELLERKTLPPLKKGALKTSEFFDRKALKEGDLVTVKAYKNQRGRLTPCFYKRELKHVQNEIAKSNRSNSLSESIMAKASEAAPLETQAASQDNWQLW